MAANAYPRFHASRTYTHPVLGRVKVLDFTNKNRQNLPDGSGAQTDFYRNNAQINNPKQFGIKLFSTSIEALAAYQRQRLAARKRLAPPVGSIIQWKIGRWSRWGYETCIADTSGNASTVALIKANKRVKAIYNAWANWAAVDPKDYAGNISRFQKDTDPDLIYVRDELGNCAIKDYNPVLRDGRDLLTDGRVRFDPRNNRYVIKWDISWYSLDDRHSTLLHRLKDVDLTGTQYDNLWDLHDDGCNSFAPDPRLFLGSKWDSTDEASLGGDLHGGNIALWRGRPVCIDFGFHCVRSTATDWDNLA